ncbi:helicase associated domain-containing protein [Streptomyces sp. NPDC057496]|uniref:helicase associated domain-containing protein n=1 Tax=Streptomyces sp. NPDC057496 TaxID=3346149 RepID=UPI0036AFD712
MSPDQPQQFRPAEAGRTEPSQPEAAHHPAKPRRSPVARTWSPPALRPDPERAAIRAEQLAAIDPDWNCPWPLSWQRHYRVLADLVDADGVLPYIAPGIVFEGDDIGTWRWRQQEPGTWVQLLPEQRERLTALGVQGSSLAVTAPAPAELPPALAALKGARKAGSKAEAAFLRGLAALAQWVEREGADRPVPRSAVVEIVVEGEAEPVPVKLGVWLSNTKTRRDKLTAEQRAALAALGMEWAGPVPVVEAVPEPPAS